MCKDTGLIPTNLEFARANNLIETRTYLEFEINNKKQEENYKKYLSSLPQKFIYTRPESAECKLPLGPDNNPVVLFTGPVANSSYSQGQVINFTVSTRALETIQHVQYQLDSVNIPAGRITTAPYSYDYTVPMTLTPGSHTFAAVITDNLGKSSYATLPLTITSAAPAMTLTLSIDETVSIGTDFPVPMTVTVANGTPTSVKVTIYGPTSYVKEFDMTKSGSTWTANWTGGSVTAGTYHAAATSDTGVTSNTVNIVVTP